MAKPVIKWVGGKTQLLKELKEIITPELLEGHTYYEPFIGGGALAFNLEHRPTVINDLNSELVNLYNIVKNQPEDLLMKLEQFRSKHSEDFFYYVRGLDRTPAFDSVDAVSKAARTIYLNKTCYNGLYRVNQKGQFNAPYGATSSGKAPTIVDTEAIRNLSDFLQDVEITNKDYRDACCMAEAGDVIFFDPPYSYEDGNGFVGYQKSGWTDADLIELKNFCDLLIDKGCRVIISNNFTTFVSKLFTDTRYNIKLVEARRNVNSKGSKRGPVQEVIIYSKNCVR